MRIRQAFRAIALIGLFGAAALTLDVDIRVKEVWAKSATPTKEWSPTKPSPNREVYYPGTEALAPDDMHMEFKIDCPL